MTNAELAARMNPWSEAEISRFLKRVAMFTKRGLTEAQAERVADHLALRDQERDDRRMCIECSHWKRARSCLLDLPPSFLQLFRCVSFEWQKP